jgi:membrane protease YdiL (CAAX protease family)
VLDLIGSYGPAIAAVAFAVVADESAAVGRAATVVAGLALLVSVWVLSSSWRKGLDTGASGFVLAGLSVATFLPAAVTWFWPPRPGDRARLGNDWMSRPWVTRPPWTRLGWLVVALLLFPVTSAVGSAVVGLRSGSGLTLAGGSAWPADATAVVGVFAATALYGGPLGEEPGWRGFALPRLQMALSPLLASVVVGIGWAAWHLPLQLRGAYEPSMGAGLWGVGLRFASQVAVSVIFTWILNRSNGSLLAVVVLHTSLNNTAGYWLPNNIGFQVAVGLLALILVLVGRMDRRTSVSATDG